MFILVTIAILLGLGLILLLNRSSLPIAAEKAYYQPRDVEQQRLPFLSRADLAANKRAAGRPKDLADLAALEGDE